MKFHAFSASASDTPFGIHVGGGSELTFTGQIYQGSSPTIRKLRLLIRTPSTEKTTVQVPVKSSSLTASKSR